MCQQRQAMVVTGAGTVGAGWGNGKATAVLLARQGGVVQIGMNLTYAGVTIAPEFERHLALDPATAMFHRIPSGRFSLRHTQDHFSYGATYEAGSIEAAETFHAITPQIGARYGGFELGMDCPNDRYVNDEEICQAVAAMLGRIGVKVTVNALPKARYFEKAGPKRYDSSFNLLGWTPSSLESYGALTNLLRCRDKDGKGGTFNFGGYCNPHVDALIDQILVEADTAKRNDLITEAFRLVHDDVGVIPLHQQSLAWGVSRKINAVQRADNQIRFEAIRMQ